MSEISPIFAHLRSEFTQALVICRENSDKRAVHAVRTGTRRMEALLRKVLEDHPGATNLHFQAHKALRQLKKIRRMSGGVRDLDVHLKLAEGLKDKIPPPEGTPREDLTREFEQLIEHLNRHREVEAAELREGLTKRELPLERGLERTAIEIAGLTADFPSPLATAREWMQRSSLPAMGLHEGNLHDYRKQTKKARYLAELDDTSQSAGRFAGELHKIQDAIGDWHDLDLLLAEAKEALGEQSTTVIALTKKRDEALSEAMKMATASPSAQND